MKNTKFVVKVNRGGTLKPEYVQRIDRTPIQMTSDRKLALLMGKVNGRGCCQIDRNDPVQPGVGLSSGQRLIRHRTEQRNARNPLGYGHPLVTT